MGVAAKFLMEYFIPEQKENNLMKRVIVNGSMTVFALTLFGSLAHSISTTAWSTDLYVYAMFQAFLAILFVAFLLVTDAMKVFVDSVTEVGRDDPERLKAFEAALLAKD